jgi:hypothetical protein
MRLGTPIDYLSSRGEDLPLNSLRTRHLRKRPFGANTRVLALLVVIAGILTFFIPFISIDQPVAGVTHWSEADIVLQMYKGNLPDPVCERCGEPMIRSLMALPFTITSIYVLMLVALVPLSVPYASKTVWAIAAVGGMESLYLHRIGTRWALEETFYGHFFRAAHVHYMPLQLALVGIMGTLFLVSISED